MLTSKLAPPLPPQVGPGVQSRSYVLRVQYIDAEVPLRWSWRPSPLGDGGPVMYEHYLEGLETEGGILDIPGYVSRTRTRTIRPKNNAVLSADLTASFLRTTLGPERIFD